MATCYHERLNAILHEHASDVDQLLVAYWQRQVAFAVEGNWLAFVRLQQHVRSGHAEPSFVWSPAGGSAEAEPLTTSELLRIEGMGIPIASLLQSHGISSFAQLANCSAARLEAIIRGGGGVFRPGDLTTWLQLATFADAGNWPAFVQLQQHVRSYRSAGAAVGTADALNMIKGIGPKISRLLQQHGITSFAQLALCSTEQLRGVLDSAGNQFRLANPATWAMQAALAADGNWYALKKLQQTLKVKRS